MCQKFETQQPEERGKSSALHQANKLSISSDKSTSSPERFSIPGFEAREKRPGDEVGWWIIFLSPAARVSCLWRAFRQA